MLDTQSSFTNNSAIMGGAIYVTDPTSRFNLSSPASIEANRGYYGGVIYATDSATVTVTQT